jgi:hypothetical protein
MLAWGWSTMRRAWRWTVVVAVGTVVAAVGVPVAGAALTVDWQRSAGIELESVAWDGDEAVVVGSVDLPDVRYAALLVRKYDELGKVAWTRTWHPQGTRVNGLDVTIDAEGAVYVAGEVARANLEGGGYFLRKYSARGELRWGRVSEGGYVGGPDIPEIATGVSAFGRHVIVVGHRYGCCGSAADDGWIRSFRPNGSQRWTRNFEVPEVDRRTNDVALEVDTDARGAYVVGHVETARRVDLSERVDTELVAQKVSFTGERRWTFVLRDRDVRDRDEGTDIAVGAGVYIVGDVNGRRFSHGEGFAARITRGGVFDWRRIWGEPADGIAPSVVDVTASGDPLVVGTIADPDDATLDVFLRLIDADGSLNQQVVVDRARSFAATAVAVDGANAAYVAGWLELSDETHGGRLWRWTT